jgi:hypothetical protein
MFINATCLAGQLFGYLESHAPACFHNCTGTGQNQTSSCFQRCVKDAVVGNATSGVAGVSIDAMVSVWENAFGPSNGGCPLLNLTVPTDTYTDVRFFSTSGQKAFDSKIRPKSSNPTPENPTLHEERF